MLLAIFGRAAALLISSLLAAKPQAATLPLWLVVGWRWGCWSGVGSHGGGSRRGHEVEVEGTLPDTAKGDCVQRDQSPWNREVSGSLCGDLMHREHRAADQSCTSCRKLVFGRWLTTHFIQSGFLPFGIRLVRAFYLP